MKKSLLLVLFVCIATPCFAWSWNKKPQPASPKPTPTAVAVVQQTPASVQQARELVRQLNSELSTAKAENLKLKDNLAGATSKLQAAEQKTAEVQKQADSLKEWGSIQAAEAQKFMEKYNAAVKRYHRLKIIAAIIAGAVGVLIGMQFMNLAPPPYNFGVPVGAAALFAALVWFFL